MITPSFSPTATERVLPKLALDFTTASLDSRITFTRALNTATCVNSSGNVEVVNANLPRFDYDPTTLVCKGLLIEESRTNGIRNNTMQGAVVGNPGTIPTNWFTYTAVSGLTSQVTALGLENGIDYVDIRISGTPSGSGTFGIYFEGNSNISASNGQTWAQSLYLKLQSGSLTGISSITLRQDERSSGGYLKTNTSGALTVTNASLITQRQTYVSTLSGGATVAYLVPFLFVSFAATAIDITLRIGLPQLELGAFATSVIKTSSGAVTRNADVATMTGTNFSSWYNQSEGSFSINVQQVFDKGFFTPIYVDDNSTTDGIFLQNRVPTNLVSFQIEDNDVTSVDIRTGVTFPNGYIACFGYKTNNCGLAVNGGATTTDTTATIPTAMTQMGIGCRPVNSSVGSMIIAKLAYYSQRLTNAELQAFSK